MRRHNHNKERLNRNRQEFLLTFFDGDEYQEKEVNGFWLVKQFNRNEGAWQVAIYTPEAFKKYQDIKKYPMLFGGQDEHINNLWRESQRN